MPNNIIQIKKNNLVLFILSVITFLFFTTLSFNYTSSLIIDSMDKIIGRTLRDPQKWSRIIKGILHIPVFFCAIFIFNNFFVLGIKNSQKTKQIFYNIFSKFKKSDFIAFILFFTVFFFIAYYKIIDADFYYADDKARLIGDDKSSWISFGRYVSEFLSILVHTSFPLADVAPLTQFVSIFIMAFSLMILTLVLGVGLKILKAIPLTFLFISPFFSQAFSYRFDSIYMTLAVFFALLPFLFKEDKITYIYSSIVFLVLSCMCYQAATSVYIVLVIFISLDRIKNNQNIKESIYFILISAISFCSALLIYKFLFDCPPAPKYFLPSTEENYFSTLVSIKMIPQNIKNYVLIVANNVGGIWIKVFIICSAIIYFVFSIKNSKINKVIFSALSIVSIDLAFILSFGPYMIFEKTLLAPRVFMGFNMFVGLILFFCVKDIFLTTASIKSKWLFSIPTHFVIYGCITFLYVYGNCLSHQKEYSDFRFQLIINDMNEYIKEGDIYISFTGESTEYCQALDVAVKQYPIINILLENQPSPNSSWNDDYLYKFNLVSEQGNSKEKLPLLKESYYHDLYGKDNHFVVNLKR